MKSAGLSSKFRKEFTKTTKMTAFDNLQQIHLGTKEKQKSLKMQAERMRLEQMKKDSQAAALQKPSDSEK